MADDDPALPVKAGYTLLNQKVTPELLASCSTKEARKTLDQKTAQLLNALPLGLFELKGTKTLSVAVSELVDQREVYSALRFSTGFEIHLVLIEPDCLESAMALCYQGSESVLEGAVDNIVHLSYEGKDDLDPEHVPLGAIPQFLQSLFEYAVAHNCSDLHIIPKSSSCIVRFRKKSEIRSHEIRTYAATVHAQILNRIKVLARIDQHVKNRALEGRISLSLKRKHYSLRVSILPTIFGEKVVLRIPEKGEVKRIEQLGLDPFTIDALGDALSRKEGIILLSGPTGGGKSTTLYACLEHLQHYNLNIVTIEDPVELELEYASQTSLSDLEKPTYKQVLKALLRHDPDVIMLGEMRDQETALAAFEAALTGHLVLSTVHASGTLETLLRLKEFGVSPVIQSQVLRLIIFQRLLPTLCPHCRIPDLAASRHFQQEIFKSSGCPACGHSGFEGVQAVEETLAIDQGIKELLLQKHSFTARELYPTLSGRNFLPFKERMRRLLYSGSLDMKSCIPYR